MKLILILLTFLLVSCTVSESDLLSPKQANDLILSKDVVILDVRTPEEFKEGHLVNSENIDYYSKTFKEELNKLDKNKIYVVYCRSGRRSAETVKIMEELGFTTVFDIDGGYLAWVDSSLPFAN